VSERASCACRSRTHHVHPALDSRVMLAAHAVSVPGPPNTDAATVPSHCLHVHTPAVSTGPLEAARRTHRPWCLSEVTEAGGRRREGAGAVWRRSLLVSLLHPRPPPTTMATREWDYGKEQWDGNDEHGGAKRRKHNDGVRAPEHPLRSRALTAHADVRSRKRCARAARAADGLVHEQAQEAPRALRAERARHLPRARHGL
jgi:hypothetical protein